MEMSIDIELGGALLLVTANGTADAHSASRLLRQMCDAAEDKGVNKILVDCLALTGKLAAFERYQLGAETAECFTGRLMNVRLAYVGKPPTTDGFGVRVARNRGVITRLFSTRREALKWLDECPDIPAEDPIPDD